MVEQRIRLTIVIEIDNLVIEIDNSRKREDEQVHRTGRPEDRRSHAGLYGLDTPQAKINGKVVYGIPRRI